MCRGHALIVLWCVCRYNPATKSWHSFNDSITAPIGENAVRPPVIADFLPELAKSDSKTGADVSTASTSRCTTDDSRGPDTNVVSNPQESSAPSGESKAETIAVAEEGDDDEIAFEAARAQTALEARIDVPPPVEVDPQLAYIVVYQRRGLIPTLSLPPVDKVEKQPPARPPTPVWVPGPSSGVPPPPPGPPPGGGAGGRPPTPCGKFQAKVVVPHVPPLELSGTQAEEPRKGVSAASASASAADAEGCGAAVFRPIEEEEPSKIKRSTKSKAPDHHDHHHHRVSFREDYLPSEFSRGGGGKRKKFSHDATSVTDLVADEVIWRKRFCNVGAVVSTCVVVAHPMMFAV